MNQVNMSLSLKNQNCSQLPKLSNLTQIFLDFFGTGTLPAGKAPKTVIP